MDDLNAMPSSTEGSISNITQINSNTYRMTPKAEPHSYEAFKIAGWTDEQLIEHGYMELATLASETQPASATVKFTFTNIKQRGTRLTKKQTAKDSFEPASTVFDAQAEITKETLLSLYERFKLGIGDDEALMLGTATQSVTSMVSRKLKEKGEEGLTRTIGNFQFNIGPSLILIDVDFKQCPHNVDPIVMLNEVIGTTFGYVYRSSTTSNIYNFNGELVTNGKGCHIYVIVENGTEIPNILRIIHERLLLAGYGFVFITKSGIAEVRTPVDVKVGSPERIIYEANPILLDGYTQQRITDYVPGGILVVRELTQDETNGFERIKAKLLADAAPRIQAAKEAYAVSLGRNMADIQKIQDTNELPFDFIITLNNGTTITVADIWNNPGKYDKMSIRDPMEPEYGKDKAKIFVNTNPQGQIENIFIHSLAHGSDISYLLKQPAEMMFPEGIEDDIGSVMSSTGEINTSVASNQLGFAKYSLTGNSKSMRKQMLEDKYVLNEIAIIGQSTVIYGPPNSGKTLIVMYLLTMAIMKKSINPKNLYYINADDTFKGLIEKIEISEKNNFHMLAPGHNGLKPNMVLAIVTRLIESNECKEVILILDTVKKFTSLMDKNDASEFGNIIREFTSKGGTVISLAHVNKHKNSDGKNIHAGTTDLIDDADCAYIIDVVDDLSQRKTVEFTNYKSRGNVASTVAYSYSANKNQTYQELFDSVEEVSNVGHIKAEYTKAKSFLDNKAIIEVIASTIKSGKQQKTEIINDVAKTTKTSKIKIQEVLEFHTGNSLLLHEYWSFSIGDKNAHIYTLNENPPPPEPRVFENSPTL